MNDGYRDKLQDIVSRLNPEKASEDAAAFIEVTIQMVRELGYRSRLLYTTPQENLDYQRYCSVLCVAAGQLQESMEATPLSIRGFLVKLEIAFGVHLNIYNKVGFSEITINKFLACHTRYSKCLDVLKNEWDKYPFMDEVNFFVESYVTMFHHYFKTNALEATKQMRLGTDPGETPP